MKENLDFYPKRRNNKMANKTQNSPFKELETIEHSKPSPIWKNLTEEEKFACRNSGGFRSSSCPSYHPYSEEAKDWMAWIDTKTWYNPGHNHRYRLVVTNTKTGESHVLDEVFHPDKIEFFERGQDGVSEIEVRRVTYHKYAFQPRLNSASPNEKK